VQYFWLVNPVYAAIVNLDLERGGGFVLSWVDFVALFGLGGVTFGLFLLQLRTRSLLPPPLPLAEREPVPGHAAP